MDGSYHYTPYLWPLAASTLFLLALAVAGYRRRATAGAVPFALAAVFSLLWMVGEAFELAAVSIDDKIFWVKFQAIWMVPAITAILFFALELANPKHKLPGWSGLLAAIPPILLASLVATNQGHQLFWSSVTYQQNVHTIHSYLGWVFIIYAIGLWIWTLYILIRLYIRSPVHRRPVALILCGIFMNRTAFLLDVAEFNLIPPLDLLAPAIVISAALYGIALFRFALFDPIPMARDKVLTQMREGMLVLDTSGRIVEWNPEAESLLGRPPTEIRGHSLPALLPGSIDLSPPADPTRPRRLEIDMGAALDNRTFALSLSPLNDPLGNALGHLLLFHDVTEQKRAQSQLMAQQRVVATMQERERLARELHDSAGQILGYVSMQAQAIRKHVCDGNLRQADTQLARLAEEASAAHLDIRESILSLKAGSGTSLPFVAALRQYVATYGEHYGIRAELAIPEELDDDIVSPDTSVQLIRVVGEALSNARKHSRADHVRITLDREDGAMRLAIADDGQGFDPSRAASETHYGLAFMRERMTQVGGGLEINSCPGRGTRVSLWVPITEPQEVEQ